MAPARRSICRRPALEVSTIPAALQTPDSTVVLVRGKLISGLQGVLRKLSSSPSWLRFAGVLLAAIPCGAAYLGVSLLIHWATGLSWMAGMICSALLAYTTLATRDLHVETQKVFLALEAEDLPQARLELSFLVGRDTAHLEEPEILRALVETVAENISDGVIAPLFYLALGGPAWAMTYKAINTLDSMVGYRDERFRHIGWASAKLDDVANFLPARISGGIIVLSSLILGKRWKDSLRILGRDYANHQSPNSAWPEAAMAGALGVQLGGLNYYFGQPSRKPFIGDRGKMIDREDVKEAWKILYLSSFFMLLVALVLSWVGRRILPLP
jgi:adenosylcobinamide-phosphate synthase